VCKNKKSKSLANSSCAIWLLASLPSQKYPINLVATDRLSFSDTIDQFRLLPLKMTEKHILELAVDLNEYSQPYFSKSCCTINNPKPEPPVSRLLLKSGR